MADETFPSGTPIRKISELLPNVFRTEANEKFLAGTIDPLIQPGKLDKTVGYVGRRYGKTFNPRDVYLDDDETLRSRYQLEAGVVVGKDDRISDFYDYIDFKNQLKFFGNDIDRDDLITYQESYTWDPPIDWDKFANFREYYWIPEGPPPVKVLGQAQEIVSTYKVRLGVGSVFIFTPDGFKNNPTITLYRGQTYKFNVNAPDNGFVIRTNYDTGSLAYNPTKSYSQGEFAIFDGKLWQAKTSIPFTEGSTINEQSQDWQYVEDAIQPQSFDYNRGITNNGVIQGTLTFEVPLDAPDVLFYQSFSDPNRFGRFVIEDVEANTAINVNQEVIGKSTYTSSNGVTFSNGLIVRFFGQVSPRQYSDDTWIVEGVGSEITLVRFQDLSIPQIAKQIPEVLFDNAGFDTEPFDDATSYPGSKDYITINRSSQDQNPWSRYNRWFHSSVLKFSNEFNGSSFDLSSETRAKRPIIEFQSDLGLLNHGTKAKKPVDYIDTVTEDVFSLIEGSQGYYVDGEELFQGARVLFTADTDMLANNRIYEVNFINHSTGSVFRNEWDVQTSYRNGETVRFAGQSFTSRQSLPSYSVTVVGSLDSSNRFRIAKNSDIRIDQAIVFKGGVFGGVQQDVLYFVREVFNTNLSFTEFTISITKRGNPLNLSTGAPGLQSLTAIFAEHPTNIDYWFISRDRRQISLRQVSDTESETNDCVLVKRGTANRQVMYHYDGTVWRLSQQKTAVNQSPKFDVFDDDGISFSDVDKYPVSTFQGSEILSYKIGNSRMDRELGFSLSYLNIDNIGDILFEFDWDKESFDYEIGLDVFSKKISTGYYQFNKNGNLGNCWNKLDPILYQPIVYSGIVESEQDFVELDAVRWREISDRDIRKIILYINGTVYNGSYTREDNRFFFDPALSPGDSVNVRIFVDAVPDNGYYEIPISLEKNPLNAALTEFTLGQAVDHVSTALDVYDDFTGNFPGISNLRDLDGFQRYCRRFLKHSNIAPSAIQLLCDKDVNIIKSLEFAAKSYRDFKNLFMQTASQLDYDQDPVNFVDTVINHLNRSKNDSDAFIDSDMLGVGAYSSIRYEVEDEGIKTFALSEKFDLREASRRAVYIYKNGVQLFNDLEYKFNSNFGFVELLVELSEGDEIEIREYVSTVYCYVPPTPTKLGLYKKFQPQIFLDDTYLNPITVIQGHDGSITVAYNDYRDDVLLELEKRIYNNIKIQYSSNVFDIDATFAGHAGGGIYSKEEFESAISRQFRKWAVQLRVDSVVNSYYIDQEPFTYNYREMSGPNDSDLPGYWRGIYRYFYDTDRPHRCPWEMLGFSEKPIWWDSEYGEPPYTSNNLILWEDIRDGIIRQGERKGVYRRYQRPTILSHIPVDGDGNLLDPISSNLISFLNVNSAKNDFTFSDVAPAEYSWRSSSEYPYSVLIACCLLRPFEYIFSNLDRLSISKNKLDQTVNKDTDSFPRLIDVRISQIGGEQTSGLINYLVDYQRYKGTDTATFMEKISSIDVRLSTRLSGFVDKQQQRYILDSKNPRSNSSSIFIPQENYQIVFNVSAPIKTLSYSAIIVAKTDRGLQVFGYDNIEPVFKYYRFFSSSTDPIISVGGVSENFLEWEPGKTFNNGTIVRVGQSFYKAVRTHTSSDDFEIDKWQRIAKLPLVGAAEAIKRTKFNRSSVESISYGTVFNRLQDLVDFICGYEEYLIDQGFEFDQYDQELAVPRNWTTSIKELLFWTKHNWSVGSLISLSPAASKLVINSEIGVLENLLDSFYEYTIFQSDGNLIPAELINVNRNFRRVEIDVTSPEIGIYLFRGYLVLKEHVAIFSDRTVFNDVIYDKSTGYRQERIKSRGFRTIDWDGDYTSPGFIFDNVNILPWQPFVDYSLGDIVEYKSYYYTSLKVQRGLSKFDDTKWTRLDLIPEQQLIANFDFKANQFSDFYDLDSDGVGQSQRDLARHALAYQRRDYLESIAEDEVTQFKIFQGFIRDKGTLNAVDKVFSKLSRKQGKIAINEEWAFKLGDIGGKDQVYEIEFFIEKSKLESNPQPILIVEEVVNRDLRQDQYYRITQNNFSRFTGPFTKDIIPTKDYLGLTRSAGYVNARDVEFVVKDRDSLLSIDIESIPVNSHLWLTFDQSSWTVLRFEFDRTFIIRDISGPADIVIQSPDSNDLITKKVISLTVNRSISLNQGDIIGIKDIKDLTGFYKVLRSQPTRIDIEVPEDQIEVDYESSTISYNLYFFNQSRFPNFGDLDQKTSALLPRSSRLWIDDGYSDKDKWQVIEKNKRYSLLDIQDYFITEPTGIGAAVAYSETLKQSFFSITGSGYVAVAVEFNNALLVKQLIAPVTDLENYVNHSFGESLAVSPDGKWLAVGSPRASGAPNDFQGVFDPSQTYDTGDIVLFRGRLWRATAQFTGDSSGFVLDGTKENWVSVDSMKVNLSGDALGPTNHGMVSLYRFQRGQWVADEVLLSPRIDTGELFGSEVKLAVDGKTVYLVVSAKGSANNLGRVYIYVYENNSWKISQDQNYKGVYDGQAETYPAGSIVWFENSLWKAISNTSGNGNPILDTNSGLWEKISSANIETALPQRISYDLDDGSTLSTGLLEDSTLGISMAELVKMGDQFGHSLAVNADASIIAIGAPLADNRYFDDFRGDWRPYQRYKTGDVVRVKDVITGSVSYRILYDPRSDDDPNTDSSDPYVSINEDPAGDPWEQIGDSDFSPIGKVFVYQRGSNNVYVLKQTLSADSLQSFSDIDIELISSGDQFGHSIDLDSSGYTLVISSPFSDADFRSQGSVFVFRTQSVEDVEYRLKQKLQSFEKYPSEQFGSSISISSRSERLVVGARNAKFKFSIAFDQSSTVFDGGKTIFLEDRGNSGQVYVFEKKDQIYFLVEKLDEDLQDFESFGEKVDCSNDYILTSSPKYRQLVSAGNFVPGTVYSIKSAGNTDWYAVGLPTSSRPIYGSNFQATGVGDGSGTVFSQAAIGKVRLFKKTANLDSWTVIREETELVDIDKIKNVKLLDKENSVKIADLDFVDNFKLKILGIAEQEIKFKTLYDPAVYTKATDAFEVDVNQPWYETHIGQLWWDLSTVKFYNFEQSDIFYRVSQANKQVPFSSVDVYEWVESKFLPSQWSQLADSPGGIAQGISGQPKFPDDTVYSVKVLFNPATGETTETRYYYWVKNKAIIPQDVPGRRTSASDVSRLIDAPESSGIPYISFIDRDKFLIYNIESSISVDEAFINIEFNKGYESLNPVHKEYLLLTEGLADSLPNHQLEAKWIDSLVGYDLSGRKIPDETLSESQRYGVSFRPRQTMFVDRFPALDAVLTNINSMLLTRPFADVIDFKNLMSFDPEPSDTLNEFDVRVENAIDLQNVGTVRVKRAILIPNIVNGRIDTISIRDPGFGYKITPFIEIIGDGEDAEALITIDNLGRVVSVSVTNQGRNYTSAIVSIRNLSVLVNRDENNRNRWAIYAWDDQRKVFIKSKIQAFDTRQYWKYADWYEQGYGITTKINTEILSLFQESTITSEIDDVIRVKEFGSGGWALLRRTDENQGDILGNYELIGRQSGTIQILKEDFLPNDRIGFDTTITFDGDIYDLQPTRELRNILKSVREDIFTESLRVEWNRLFFDSVRYAFVQNPSVDWAFKTSFLTAKHSIGELDQRISYKNDNIDSFQSYLEEVKPYRSTIREYITQYDSVDENFSAVSDFDSPPTFSLTDGKIMPVGRDYRRLEYPWKSFLDNQGYEITAIDVYTEGEAYSFPPSVLIEGDGTGCVARAYIANGKVSGIEVIDPGQGYTSAPMISLVGGNGTNRNIARAAAKIGNPVIRSLSTMIRFDRLSKTRNLQDFVQRETMIAGGFTASFDLKYAPMIDKDKITVYKNSQLVLSDQYSITLFRSGKLGGGELKGKIIFQEVPGAGDQIELIYDKNNEYLDSLSRIEKYYAPQEGMKGKEFGQLMTGIDFGGVQIQGTTFDVTGGWDALPWFTDNWDSVESSSDFYYIADGSTIYVDLPFVPDAGENISIYLQRQRRESPRNIDTLNDPTVDPVVVLNKEILPDPPRRIDDPNYGPAGDSTLITNVNALMPTFIGDGVSNRVEFVDPITDMPYLNLEAGDKLIFRRDSSDGSVTIRDINIIDTAISGGSLSAMEGAYVTATGKTAEEITIDGDKFISPDQVTAPEENVPGQVLEGLSIKVFHSILQGASPVQNAVYLADGVSRQFDIKLRILESKSLIAYQDKVRLDTSVFEIDYNSNTIIFDVAPQLGSIIEIISIGVGGINLLDYQEFTGDGETDLFLTAARFRETATILVTVDGNEVDAVFYDSQEFTDQSGRTIVQIGSKPSPSQIIKIVVMGPGSDTDSSDQSLIRFNSQTVFYDGSTTQFDLDRFVNLTRASATSSIIVELNGDLLVGPDTIRVVYDGTNNVIEIGVDPQRVSGAIGLNDFEVYINNQIQPAIVAYTFNSFSKTVTVNPILLNVNDEIKIITYILHDYRVVGNNLIITDTKSNMMSEGDRLDITWFSEYPSFDIITDEYQGGQIAYLLKRNPISDSYIWVYKNGQRLTLNQDYSLDLGNRSVILKQKTTDNDVIKIIEFGNRVWSLPHGYEIYKDMLNLTYYKRFSFNDFRLAEDLTYYATEIVLDNAVGLFEPDPSRNQPGMIFVNKEKIEYLSKNGNKLSQLRRGAYGTPIGEIYQAGSRVSDLSKSESIPYSDIQDRYDFVSDGSTALIGPLDFVPIKSQRNFWFRNTIPVTYGACDEFEVFAGGQRLRKDPIDRYNEDLGSASPLADETIEAEFSVDGINPYIRLTEIVPAGTRVHIIKKRGKTWYDKGTNTAQNGRTMTENTNPIIRFILGKDTYLPE